MGVLLFLVLLYSPHIVSLFNVFRKEDLEKYKEYSLLGTFFSIFVLTSVIVDQFLLTENISYSAHEETYAGSATLPEWIDPKEVGLLVTDEGDIFNLDINEEYEHCTTLNNI